MNVEGNNSKEMNQLTMQEWGRALQRTLGSVWPQVIGHTFTDSDLGAQLAKVLWFNNNSGGSVLP